MGDFSLTCVCVCVVISQKKKVFRTTKKRTAYVTNLTPPLGIILIPLNFFPHVQLGERSTLNCNFKGEFMHNKNPSLLNRSIAQAFEIEELIVYMCVCFDVSIDSYI